MTAPYKWHPMLRRGVRGPQRDDPEKHWTPVRFVPAPIPCSFCGFTIPAGKPGNTRGMRGTKAFYNRLTKEWECTACRLEGMDAARIGAVSSILGPEVKP